MSEDFKIDKVSIRLVKDSSLTIDYPLNTPDKISEIIGNELREMDREVFCVIHMTSDLSVLSYTFASVGAIDRTIASPREIFKGAILSNAASIVVMHNHPSGNIQPSDIDLAVTKRLNDACNIMGIPLNDHIIVGPRNLNYYSFREHDLIIGKKDSSVSLAAENIESFGKSR